MAAFNVSVPLNGGYSSTYQYKSVGQHTVAGQGEPLSQVSVFNSAGKSIGGPFAVGKNGEWGGEITITQEMITPSGDGSNAVRGTVDIKAVQQSPKAEYGLRFNVQGIRDGQPDF